MSIMPTGSYSEMQKPTRIIVFDARNPGSDALEPCEAKVSSTVLGGVGGSNPSRLLDTKSCGVTDTVHNIFVPGFIRSPTFSKRY